MLVRNIRGYRSLSAPIDMSCLIYSDSFQDDEDLCNVIAAMQLGDRPPANPPPSTPSNSASSPAACPPSRSGAGVDNDHGHNKGHKDLQQGGALATPASESRPVIHRQHWAPTNSPPGMLPNLLILSPLRSL